MTEHDPLPVKGYTKQSEQKVDTVNVHKQVEEKLLRRMDEFSLDPQMDQRWLAIARTHLEQGFMALNRAVFCPQRVKLDGDP